MSLARESVIKARGWQDESEPMSANDEIRQQHLDFAHKVAKCFSTKEGKEVLDFMVQKYLLADIVASNDTQFGVGIKQGKASVVKQMLAQIELSNNS